MNIASGVNLLLAMKSGNDESFVSKPQIKLVMAIFLPCVVYVAAMQLLGLYVASVIFIAIFMKWQGKFGIVKSIVTSVVVVAVLFVMFEIWFKVPLIKGPLEAFLGY